MNHDHDSHSASDLKAQRERDDLRVVLRTLEDYPHLFGRGVDLATVAARMRDLARMPEGDRAAMLVRRMTPPSPWVDDFGHQADRTQPPALHDRRRAEPLPARVLDRMRADYYDPCVEAAMAIRYDRM